MQWNSWLRRTRRSAPTLDELTIDVQRLQSVTANVNRLAIEYKAEKLRALEAPAAAPLGLVAGLAAGLRSPELVAREEAELRSQRLVMEKEEERRRLEDEAMNPVVVEPAGVVVEEIVLEPVKLGEDRERTLAKMRRAAG